MQCLPYRVFSSIAEAGGGPASLDDIFAPLSSVRSEKCLYYQFICQPCISHISSAQQKQAHPFRCSANKCAAARCPRLCSLTAWPVNGRAFVKTPRAHTMWAASPSGKRLKYFDVNK